MLKPIDLTHHHHHQLFHPPYISTIRVFSREKLGAVQSDSTEAASPIAKTICIKPRVDGNIHASSTRKDRDIRNCFKTLD